MNEDPFDAQSASAPPAVNTGAERRNEPYR
jgi:hypothetical protein